MPPSGGDSEGIDHAARKADHLRLALGDDVGFDALTTGLDAVRVRARALPERDLDDVDLGTTLWGRRLRAPLLLSCMTGGVSEAGPVNRALATAAQAHGVAVGLGSGRVLLEDPRRSAGFEVREVAPDVPVLANLGVAQLREHDPDACRWLVERCDADALVVHLNAIQEAVQPGGDTQLSGMLDRIAALVVELPVPVVVKEVGFGMAPEDVVALAGVRVAGIDVAGAGGTNWARLEGHRDAEAADVAAAFVDWGWPTAVAVRQARAVLDQQEHDVTLVGSGGLRHGVDALKVLCLGADLASVGRGVLAAAVDGERTASRRVATIVEQLRIAAWAAGARGMGDLTSERLENRVARGIAGPGGDPRLGARKD